MQNMKKFCLVVIYSLAKKIRRPFNLPSTVFAQEVDFTLQDDLNLIIIGLTSYWFFGQRTYCHFTPRSQQTLIHQMQSGG